MQAFDVRSNSKQKNADKRELVLCAAAAVFSYSGYGKASVDEIAKRAGVGKGTVYQVAESKEELFLLVVEREVKAWHDAIEKVIDESVPAEQLLFTVEAEAMRVVHDNAVLRDLFCGDTSSMLARSEMRLHSLRSVGAEHLKRVLEIGIRQGVWRKELDAGLVADVLQDMWLGAWMLEPSNLTTDAQFGRMAAAIDLMLHGLKTRAA